MLSERLNFTFELVEQRDGVYGYKDSSSAGSWTGLVGLLASGAVDVGLFLSRTAAREEVIDFVDAAEVLGAKFVALKGSRQAASGALLKHLKPLSYATWVCVIMMSISVAAALFLSHRGMGLLHSLGLTVSILLQHDQVKN